MILIMALIFQIPVFSQESETFDFATSREDYCSKVMESLTNPASRIPSAYLEITEINLLSATVGRFLRMDEEVVAGRIVPTWQEVEDLKHIEESLKEYHSRVGHERYNLTMQYVAEKFFSEQYLSTKGKAIKKFKKPGQADLVVYTRSIVERIRSFIPRRLVGPLPKIPIEDKAKINRKAVELVKRDERRFIEEFRDNTGKTLAEVREAVRETEDQYKIALMDRLANEDLEFAMRARESSRWWAPKVGFHNVHTTSSSAIGDSVQTRLAVEAKISRQEIPDFQKRDQDMMPKYGYITDPLESGKFPYRVGSSYGKDDYIFKKDRVRDRLTFAMGDSIEKIRDTDKLDWSMRFIPWSHREVFAAMDSGLVPLSVNGNLSKDILRAKRLVMSAPFIELQYWGRLTLDDVEAFVFSDTPPDGEFLEELQKRQIKIYRKNLNDNVIEPWEPDS